MRDVEGKGYTVRYEAVNAMLLNEFLKEHRKVQGLEVTVARQQREFRATAAQQQAEIKSLVARLNEQDSKIQKVNAQLAAASPSPGGLELSKFATGRIRRGGPAPRTVVEK